jgi:recombinational DNA repair protein (RecF pathway)
LREDHLEKIKSLAYWQRKNIKEVIDEILQEYLRGKKIKSRRKK